MSTSESSVQKAAESATFRFFARACMVVVAMVGLPLAGVAGKRILDTLDKIVEKQDSTKDEINRINQSIIRIEGANLLINGRIDSVNRDFTSRIDALSAWTRKNSDEIDKVKDWFLKPVNRN